jgi:16S rRNA (guanine966-N2)-methyltransferase
MFAGSGSLGFEALSRGATHVTMVDASRKIIEQLRKNAALLQTDAIDFHWARMPERLNSIHAQKFDIIFIDPPFHFGLVKLSCAKLEHSNYLHDHTLVYIECERELLIGDILAPSWQILRKKKSGLTRSYLCRRRA